MSNLFSRFVRASKSYGRWSAMSEARDFIKANLSYRHEVYARHVVGLYEQREWAKVHQWGQEISVLFAATPTAALIYKINRAPEFVSYSVKEKLRQKLRDMEDADGERMFETCTSCDTLAVRSEMVEIVNRDDSHVCPHCVSRNRVRESNCMDGFIWSNESNTCYHTETQVGDEDYDWCTQDWARDNEYVRHGGIWYAPGAFNINTTINVGILSYHSGVDLPRIASKYDKRKPSVLLGMELEVENRDGERDEGSDDDEDEDYDRYDEESNTKIAKSILRKLNGATRGYMKCETDGSLNNGFEMITAPTGLDVHERTLKLLSETKYFSAMRSHDTSTCGLHVHVCKAGMTVLHAAKLQQFINSTDNTALVRTVARRYQTESGYAKIERRDWIAHMGAVVGPTYRLQRERGNKVAHSMFTGDRFSYERYAALNFRNDHTVEFRLFRGTLKFESIMACLEFAYACWFFTREASVNELTTEQFMKFIVRADNRGDTKYLRAYLKAKKFRAFYQVEGDVSRKFKLPVPTAVEERNALDTEPRHYLPTPEQQRAEAVSRRAAVAA